MNGQPRCCASMRPSVDLPAPRRPTSAMRRARSAPPAGATRASIALASSGSSPSGTCARRSMMAPSAGGARAGLRQQRRRPAGRALAQWREHADRRIAGAAFDLRQIAFGGLGGLRQLPARHAALGAMPPHLRADARRGKDRSRQAEWSWPQVWEQASRKASRPACSQILRLAWPPVSQPTWLRV